MKGFFMSFFINMLFRYELLVLTIVAWLAHLFFNLPIIITYVFLGLWILIPLVITLGLGVLTRGTPAPSTQKNVNPYSKSTDDFTEKE